MHAQNIETYCNFQRALKLKLSFSTLACMLAVRLMTGLLFKLFDLREIISLDPFSRHLIAKQKDSN